MAFDVFFAFIFPTRGPLFVHSEWFAGLRDTTSGRLAEFLAWTIEAYAAMPGKVYASAGISAMPSYHVYAYTCALLCWKGLPRPIFAAALALWVANWVSTVVTGWHYFWDGAVGAGAAYFLWRVTERYVPETENPTAR